MGRNGMKQASRNSARNTVTALTKMIGRGSRWLSLILYFLKSKNQKDLGLLVQNAQKDKSSDSAMQLEIPI
jgi:hypothetical protein